MAIDTKAKRASAMNFVGHRKGRLIPDGTIASPDLQDAVGFYRGIQAADIVFILLHTTIATRRDHALTATSRTHSTTATRRMHALTATQRTHDTTATRRDHDIEINEP